MNKKLNKKIARIHTHTSDIVECNAIDYWTMLVDNWEDFLPWLTGAGQQIPVIETKLAPWSQRGVLPRTRIVHMDVSICGYPEFLSETLIYSNPETMTMNYRVDGIGANGMHNYLATTEVDEIEPGKTQVTIISRFDTYMVEQAEQAEAATKMFHALIIHNGAETCRFQAERKNETKSNLSKPLESKPEDTKKKPPASENKPQNSGGLPGSDNVPDGGATQVIEGKGDGDISKHPENE